MTWGTVFMNWVSFIRNLRAFFITWGCFFESLGYFLERLGYFLERLGYFLARLGYFLARLGYFLERLGYFSARICLNLLGLHRISIYFFFYNERNFGVTKFCVDSPLMVQLIRLSEHTKVLVLSNFFIVKLHEMFRNPVISSSDLTHNCGHAIRVSPAQHGPPYSFF